LLAGRSFPSRLKQCRSILRHTVVCTTGSEFSKSSALNAESLNHMLPCQVKVIPGVALGPTFLGPLASTFFVLPIKQKAAAARSQIRRILREFDHRDLGTNYLFLRSPVKNQFCSSDILNCDADRLEHRRFGHRTGLRSREDLPNLGIHCCIGQDHLTRLLQIYLPVIRWCLRHRALTTCGARSQAECCRTLPVLPARRHLRADWPSAQHRPLNGETRRVWRFGPAPGESG
jgi:hypothetical protein